MASTDRTERKVCAGSPDGVAGELAAVLKHADLGDGAMPLASDASFRALSVTTAAPVAAG